VPELPDITAYVDALTPRVAGQPLEHLVLTSPFLLRTVDPPVQAVEGRIVRAVRRLGKRIVFDVGDELYLALHLMIAGRLKWLKRGARPPGRITLAVLEFPAGSLAITEAGTKRRAALHLIRRVFGRWTAAGSRCSRAMPPPSPPGSGRRAIP
jgi:formamidopyrimidine-DNA glycosylase